MMNSVLRKRSVMGGRAALLSLAAAAALAGCKKEAEKFGYRGWDLEENEPSYYTIGGAVTNYLPMRVLSVSEKYDFTADETALLKAFGVVSPGVPLQGLPAGYARRSAEPWFSIFVKDGVPFFDRKGTAGFMCHHDADRNVYEVGEAFFSVYFNTLDEARAELKARRKTFEQRLRPLKFYDFADSFATEYRRLKVITAVGKCADGRFSCMTSIGDKNLEGCGEWMPVDEQQEQLDSYLFAKALAAWNAECGRIGAANHAALTKVCAERKLALFGSVELGEAAWCPGERSIHTASVQREFEWAKDDPRRETVLAETMAKASAGFGVTFGEVLTNDVDCCCGERRVTGEGELFEVCVSVTFFDPPPPPPAEEGEEPAAAPTEPQKPRVTVSVSATERLIGGRKFPARPTM